jgi:tRNA (cytidine32/uridine32-2'-O)-methyltransferase
MFNQVRIVLVNTSHPGNIGAVARAMKTMGFHRLYLVKPKRFPDKEADIRAAGAEDILAQAVVTETLPQAIMGCQYVYATSARPRYLEWPTLRPAECAQKIFLEQNQQEIAIIFGRESSGLTNEEVAYSHYLISIPTDEQFASLNLASAVQILTYEMRQSFLSTPPKPMPQRNLAAHEQFYGLITHWEQMAIALECLDPQHPKRLMQRISRLFKRAELDETEVNILRGFLSAISKKLIKTKI